MMWRVELSASAEKTLDSLPKEQAQRILKFLHQRVAPVADPRHIGEALKGQHFAGLWRYRVGDYRLICQIEDEYIRVLVLKIGHRREVYR